MNVAKNWALTIMLTALAFADFSSELLLKEQMIIPVKKKLNSAGHIDATLIDFSEICQKNPIFFRICSENPSKFDFFPLKSREIGRFSANFDFSPAKSADLWANFDFFPAKIPWNRPIFPRICPWKPREILRFFPQNIRSPVLRGKQISVRQDCRGFIKNCSSRRIVSSNRRIFWKSEALSQKVLENEPAKFAF